MINECTMWVLGDYVPYFGRILCCLVWLLHKYTNIDFILRNSYIWANVLILAFFTLSVHLWVTWRVSYISLVTLHCDTWKNSSIPRAIMLMVLTSKLYCIFSLFFLVYKCISLFSCTLLTWCERTKEPFFIASQISQSIPLIKKLVCLPISILLTIERWMFD